MNPGISISHGTPGYIRVEPFAVPAPVANFTAAPISGPAPLSVNFTDTSTGFPTSWSWDFGDGTYSAQQNPSHTFTSAGTYTVALNVTNAAGGNRTVKEGMVTVTGPVARTYSMTNVELYYPDTSLDIAYPHFNPYYTPGRAIISNLSGRLQNDGWQPAFVHNDAEVTKADFGTSGSGLSASTFHYHFGHGNTTHALTLYGYIANNVSGENPRTFDPTDSIHPSEMQWNGNLKWIIIDACSALENRDWAQPMGTTHGVLGFVSEKKPSQDFPNLFLQYALDDNESVYQAYRNATFNSFTANVTAAVIFSNREQRLNDYFPGHGTVMPDENPNDHANDSYYSWQCGNGPSDIIL